MRKWLAVMLTSMAVLTASGAAQAEAVSAFTSTSTHVRQVSPLDAAGHLRGSYTVRTNAKGYCWTTSFLNGRLFRCFQRNMIRDPCWKESGRASVVCLGAPWTRSVTRLRLTRGLPDTETYGPGIWGLKRLDGVGGRCRASAGAGEWVGNRHISYYCHDGWVLVGDIDESRALWTIAVAQRVGGHYQLRGRKPLGTAWKPVR